MCLLRPLSLDCLTLLSRPSVEETYLWTTSKWRLKAGKTKNQNLRPIWTVKWAFSNFTWHTKSWVGNLDVVSRSFEGIKADSGQLQQGLPDVILSASHWRYTEVKSACSQTSLLFILIPMKERLPLYLWKNSTIGDFPPSNCSRKNSCSMYHEINRRIRSHASRLKAIPLAWFF